MSSQNQKHNDNIYLRSFKLYYKLLYDDSRTANADTKKNK